MSSVIDQLQKVADFCRARSVDPQAIEACQQLGLHVRVTSEDFQRLQPAETTHTVFGGDNPWLLRSGYVDGIEIRSHESIEPELAKTALGHRAYITARSFNNQSAPELTATLDLATANNEANHA